MRVSSAYDNDGNLCGHYFTFHDFNDLPIDNIIVSDQIEFDLTNT